MNWILDLDLKGFFDNIEKEHLMQMVGRRIADPRVLRLIRKWLNAGVIEDGEWSETEKGTPLLHHVNVDLPRDSYYGLKRKAAPGVDA